MANCGRVTRIMLARQAGSRHQIIKDQVEEFELSPNMNGWPLRGTKWGTDMRSLVHKTSYSNMGAMWQ